MLCHKDSGMKIQHVSNPIRNENKDGNNAFHVSVRDESIIEHGDAKMISGPGPRGAPYRRDKTGMEKVFSFSY